MKDLKEIAIVHATLHQSVPIKGWAAPEKTLHHTRMPGVKMSLTPMGLVVTVKDKKGLSCNTIIPVPNIAAMQPADDKPTK